MPTVKSFASVFVINQRAVMAEAVAAALGSYTHDGDDICGDEEVRRVHSFPEEVLKKKENLAHKR